MAGWVLYKTPLHPALAAVCLAVHLNILITNILVIATFKRIKKLFLRHYYMLGLVVADLIMLIPTTAGIMALIKGDLWIDDGLCSFLGIASTSSVEITATVHTVMCIDRWVSVAYPLEYRAMVNKREAKPFTIGIIVGCNILPVLFNVLTVHLNVINFEFDPYVPSCILSSSKSSIIGVLLTLNFFIAIPMIVHTVTNIYMLYRVAKLRGLSRKRLIYSIRTVVATVLVFYVFWIPTAVRLVMAILVPQQQNLWFTFISTEFLVANSGVNFYIYVLTIPTFKSAFLSMLPKKKDQQTL